MRAECRDQVAQALGKKKLSAADSNRISQLYIRAQNILARTDSDWLLKSPAERAEAIAQKTASDLSVQIAKNNQNIARDAILKAQLEQEIYNHSTLNPIQVLMRKIAYFSDQSGIQSVEKQSQALHSRWMSLVADVFTKTQERWGLSVNKEMTDDIIRVMFGRKSDNPEIVAMAKEVSFALEEMRLAYNRAGGNIRKLDNWGFMTSHDQKKVALSTEQEWVDDVLQKLDRNQYVREDGLLMSDSEVRTMLKDVYRTIATNGANKVLDGRKIITPVGGRSKMANRHQEARALHFKDGDSWLEYQAKFGTYNETGFHEILKNHTHRMSTEIAMMQNFGSNPRLSFETLLEEASTKLKADPENGNKHGEIDKQSKRALSMYNTLDANTRAVDSTLGNVMGGLRALMVASKLGGTTLTTIGDHASTKKIANMLGLSYTKSVLPEYMKQLTQGNYRDEALRFGLGITEMVGSTSRFGDADVVSSATKSGRFNARMQQLASTTLKISGLNAVTAGMKRAFNLVHMNKIADMTRNTHWKDLSKDDLKILKGNGITEKDWNLWRELAPSKREDGALVLTQNDFFDAPDEVIMSFASSELKSLKAEIDSQVAELKRRNLEDDQRISNKVQRIKGIKRQLSQQLLDYANHKDAKARAEKQAIQDRIDLIDAQNEYVAVQADLNTYLQAEKQANRIQDFLQQVEEGRHSDKIAVNTRNNVERNAKQYGIRAENLGLRLGNAERRMTELRAKIRKADSDANKAIKQKFRELDKKVIQLDDEFAQYQIKVDERQQRRQQVVESLGKSLSPRQQEILMNTRYKAAMKYQTHIFNEESVAIIEAGVRERSIINLGDAGTIQGELGRTLFQFKGFPLAYMLRIGHRAFAQGDIKSRATFLASLLAYQTLAGAFIVQLQNFANGKNPEPVFTPDFFGKSILKGGGLSFMGDLMSALSDPTGRSFGDFVAGPLVSQGGKLGMLLTGMGNNFIEGKESTRTMEIANTLKGNLPFQNIWYSKLIIDRMLYSKLQNMIDPDYLPKTQQRLENLGNGYWWDLSE
ncbi:hypothetical protein [Acinetobacter nosocomialis]|uniref:hypothetical protein n=1 Tax=Acinetobacter nosocomialis TaxID=106654 RepID=UPI000F73B5CC|nr:hypothetical protein [Acinetobacter nosocomialis]RSN88642.1 hypothetical protein EA768_00550 [Acinetobacter nosocomialis]